MKANVLVQLVILFTAPLLLSGSLPHGSTSLQRELADLTKRGVTYRWLNDDLIELAEPVSLDKQRKYLMEKSEMEIRSWAVGRGVPILEIDPNTIDTSEYSGWYAYWATVPLGNGIGSPLMIGDVDHNGWVDLYGGYLDTLSTEYQARAYEVDTVGNVFLRYQYIPRPGGSRQIADADGDSLLEVVWSLAGVVSGYEQSSQDSLPIYRSYAHDRYYHNSSPGYTGIHIGNLDDDSLSDFLYQGTGPNPLDTNDAISETYVAEYDPALQNFVRVWSTQFYPGSGATGFAVADFDGDTKKEFVATHPTGKVYVAENTGNNAYTLVWQDSTPYVNFYDIGSGDVDNDGRIEFLTGAVISNGSWTLVYEADSNNAYSPKFLFHLLSGGLFAGAQYIAADMDGDGRLELAIKVAGELYMFKSNTDNRYYLWYLRRENAMDAVTFYDFNHDGRQDMVISKFAVNPQGMGREYAEIYLATTLVSVKVHPRFPVEISIKQNYPNPFNPSTTIEYTLSRPGLITLKVYDVLGKEVGTLLDGKRDAGKHTVLWDAKNLPSGVYLCRMQAEDYVLVIKMLLLK